MVELTIIVPIYNVKDYIEECMDSLLKIEKIKKQIICIDDVSTDGTSELLRNKYGHITDVEIYTNSKNSGLAFSRNVGLDNAQGNYIIFVDSDDYINPENINIFFKKMIQENLDILYFDVEEFAESDIDKKNLNCRIRRGRYGLNVGTEIFSNMVLNKEMFGCVWDGMYKKEFLMKYDIRFIDGILHEDIPFTFKAMLNAKRVNVIKEIGYYYRQRNNSILHQPNFSKRAQGLMIAYCQMIITWQLVRNKIDTDRIESSIIKYMNSVISMFESNINKIESKCELNSPILYNFLNNFEISKFRNYEYIYKTEFIKELLSYNNLAIYGAGKIADDIIPFLKSKNIIISNILVTNLEGNRTSLQGIQVIEFSLELIDRFDAIIICVYGNTRNEIVSYIKKQGYKGKIIFLPI